MTVVLLIKSDSHTKNIKYPGEWPKYRNGIFTSYVKCSLGHIMIRMGISQEMRGNETVR
jgi:hypothetical protein